MNKLASKENPAVFQEIERAILNFVQMTNELIYDKSTVTYLEKGRIEVNGKLIPLNVFEIIQGLAEFNSKLFKTKKTSESLQVELKHYVEGCEFTEEIVQGYMLTLEIKISTKQTLELPKGSKYFMLIAEQNRR
jgi:hypothetical protein